MINGATKGLKRRVLKPCWEYLNNIVGAEEFERACGAVETDHGDPLRNSIEFWRKEFKLNGSPEDEFLLFFGGREDFDDWAREYVRCLPSRGSDDMDAGVILNQAAAKQDAGGGWIIWLIAGIGLGVAAYLAYRSKQETEVKRKAGSKPQAGSAAPSVRQPPGPRSEEKRHLVLMINADKYESVITGLKEAGHLGVPGLETSIRKLWTGSQPFSRAQIDQNRSAEPEEYDVCLVELELDRADSRFYPDASHSDRMRALEPLKDEEHRCKVSGRLKLGVGQGFYPW